MKRTTGIISAVLLSAALASCSMGVGTESESATKKSGTGISGYKTLEVSTEAELNAIDDSEVCKNTVIVKTQPDFDKGNFARLGATILGSFDMNGATFWHLEKAGGTVKLVAALQNTKGVYYAEHELKSSLPKNETAAAVSGAAKGTGAKNAASIAAVLNDPLTWGNFAHFETTNAIKAYSTYGVGTNTVYVVDIDTGVNKNHEDFHDDSGNSIVVRAKSAFAEDGTYLGDSSTFVDAGDNWDDGGHGTHTAGTIVARGNNGKGVAGVCWKNAKLLSYKCFSETSSSSGANWAVYGGFKDMVQWKSDNNITQTIPVNMSLGGSTAGAFEEEMVASALDHGFVICASMGNDGQNRSQFPAAYAGVIAVGAATAAGTKVDFSSMGKHCSVMGPGFDIYSTSNVGTNNYVDMSGTSMSCPFVTGTVAYLLTFNPNLKADQIKTLLEETAIDMETTGFDEDTGYGLVDVYAAAKRVNDGDIPASGSVYSSGTLKVSVTNTNSNYDSGLASYPDAVTAQPVYLYDSTGAYVTVGVTDTTAGVAAFKLLPPGTYTAKTSYCDTTKSVSVTLGSSSDVSAAISYDVPILRIQTVVNNQYDSGVTNADSIITVFDSDGTTIIKGPYDHGKLDSMAVAGLTSGNTYYVLIAPYNSSFGDYGLNIGFTVKDSVTTTTGRGSRANATDDDAYEDNDTIATATLITVGSDYAQYLGDKDYFKFVMP